MYRRGSVAEVGSPGVDGQKKDEKHGHEGLREGRPERRIRVGCRRGGGGRWVTFDFRWIFTDQRLMNVKQRCDKVDKNIVQTGIGPSVKVKSFTGDP